MSSRAEIQQEMLAEESWHARRLAHETRVDGWINPVLRRSTRGETDPVEDFLFTYYSFRPGQLRRWSPGLGVVLEGATASTCATLAGGAKHWILRGSAAWLGVAPPKVRAQAAAIADLLAKTTDRRPFFGCFGLHEWAMVHRTEPAQLRHFRWPLRLGSDATNQHLDSLPLRCTHFDAFRFFAPEAAPRNQVQPTRTSQPELEQGGCLHANMDLYKWAYKLSPWVPAELLADCFALARQARVLDMRASPYDFSALGYAAVPVETPEGRREYAGAQETLAELAAPLRETLTTVAARVAASTTTASVAERGE